MSLGFLISSKVIFGYADMRNNFLFSHQYQAHTGQTESLVALCDSPLACHWFYNLDPLQELASPTPEIFIIANQIPLIL